MMSLQSQLENIRSVKQRLLWKPTESNINSVLPYMEMAAVSLNGANLLERIDNTPFTEGSV